MDKKYRSFTQARSTHFPKNPAFDRSVDRIPKFLTHRFDKASSSVLKLLIYTKKILKSGLSDSHSLNHRCLWAQYFSIKNCLDFFQTRGFLSHCEGTLIDKGITIVF